MNLDEMSPPSLYDDLFTATENLLSVSFNLRRGEQMTVSNPEHLNWINRAIASNRLEHGSLQCTLQEKTVLFREKERKLSENCSSTGKIKKECHCESCRKASTQYQLASKTIFKLVTLLDISNEGYKLLRQGRAFHSKNIETE